MKEFFSPWSFGHRSSGLRPDVWSGGGREEINAGKQENRKAGKEYEVGEEEVEEWLMDNGQWGVALRLAQGREE